MSLTARDANCSPDLNIIKTIFLDAEDIRHPLILEEGNYELVLRNMTPAAEYSLFLNVDEYRYDCHPLVELVDPRIKTHQLNEEVFSFHSIESVTKLLLTNPNCTGDLPLTLSVGLINEPEQPVENTTNMMGLFTSTTQYSAEQLIEDVFIGGDCFSVEPGSIQYSGSVLSVGYFSEGDPSISLERGVMLSTGRIEDSAGPNGMYNRGTWASGINNDPDLTEIINNPFYPVYDQASLEFDFTPTTDQISFEFVFASEEYCEYVGSSFNDVFGFFISGPGINGPFTNNATNIALVPGTSDFITINTVNHQDNSNYYINNIPVAQHSSMPLSCDNYPLVDGVAIDEIEYDGFTTVLTAMANVQACETYHIKLIIADVDDAYFDSSVFLKANSFEAGGTAIVTAEVPGFATGEITESCTDGFFKFDRGGSDLSEPVTIDYIVSNLGTATSGVDYEPIPSSITIPAGDSVYLLPINVFEDNLNEGSETIILEMLTPCSCEIPFSTIHILDGEPLIAFPDMDTLCSSAAVTLIPETLGGLPGYTYEWSTAETTPSITVNPSTSTSYSLTVTDYCGNTIVTENHVEIVGEPAALMTGFVYICEEDPQNNISVDFTGTGPFTFEYSIDNIPQTPITGITQTSYSLPVNNEGVYHPLSVQSHGCQGSVQGAATVTEISVQASLVASPLTCPNAMDGSIELSVAGGIEPYVFNWENGANTKDISGLDIGNYPVTIVDANGCIQTIDTDIVLDPGVPTVDAGVNQELDCNNIVTSLIGSGSLGSDYSYVWTTTDGNILSGANSSQIEVNGAGDYFLNITNTNTGCVMTDIASVAIDTISPISTLFVQGPTELNCLQSATILDASSSQPIGNLNFEWSTTNGSLEPGDITMPNPEIEVPGTYELKITDQTNGCTQSEDIVITSDIAPPVIAMDPAEELTCVKTITQLDAGGSDSGNNYTINWTTTNGNILSGEQTLFPTVDNPGKYSLTIFNQQNHCESTMEIEVLEDIVPPVVDAGAVAENLDCNTTSLILDATNSSTGVDYIYAWSTNDGQISEGANSPNPVIEAPGTYTLLITNEQNGCTAEDNVAVSQDLQAPVPQIIVDGVNELNCIATQTILDATASQPSGNLAFTWSTNDGQLNPGEESMPNPVISAPGLYNVMITDLVNGCTNTASTAITINVDLPSISIEDPGILTCSESSLELNASNSSQGNSFEPSWRSINGNVLANANTLEPIVDEPGIYELTITNNQNGCSVMEPVTVDQNITPPYADAGALSQMLDCNTQTLQLDGTASSIGDNYSHRWTSNSGGLTEGATTLEPIINAGGIYTLVVTNQDNGCTAADQISIEVNDNIPYDAQIEIEPPLCFGDEGSFAVVEVSGGVGPFLYSLDNGESFYTDSAYINVPVGVQELLVQDVNGCNYEKNFVIPEVFELQVQMDPVVEIRLGQEHQLEARVNIPDAQIDSIIWSPAINLSCDNCLEPMALPHEDIDYTVTVINQNGCEDEATVQFLVNRDRDIYIPNAFSPNDDGQNDFFNIYSDDFSVFEVTHLQIFSRWGEKVFEEKGFKPNQRNFGWRGTFKGQKMQAGVYVYFTEIEFVDGTKKMLKGDITLIR